MSGALEARRVRGPHPDPQPARTRATTMPGAPSAQYLAVQFERNHVRRVSLRSTDPTKPRDPDSSDAHRLPPIPRRLKMHYPPGCRCTSLSTRLQTCAFSAV